MGKGMRDMSEQEIEGERQLALAAIAWTFRIASIPQYFIVYPQAKGVQGEKVKYSNAVMSAKAFNTSGMPKILHKQFTHVLGQVDSYDWQLLKEGEFWFEDQDGPIFATEDMIHVIAYSGALREVT